MPIAGWSTGMLTVESGETGLGPAGVVPVADAVSASVVKARSAGATVYVA